MFEFSLIKPDQNLFSDNPVIPKNVKVLVLVLESFHFEADNH